MKYPDTYVTRFFFKNGLDKAPRGTVLEFGCGSAHNLRLFEDYGWEVTGIDLGSNVDFVKDALQGSWSVPHYFHPVDLDLEVPQQIKGVIYDVILLPNVTYYLKPESRIVLLNFTKEHLTEGGLWFLSERLLDDYRFGKGKEIGPNAFTLEISETGELGTSIQFFSEDEILNTLEDIFKIPRKGFVALHSRYENLQAGYTVGNSDFIVWGRNSLPA